MQAPPRQHVKNILHAHQFSDKLSHLSARLSVIVARIAHKNPARHRIRNAQRHFPCDSRKKMRLISPRAQPLRRSHSLRSRVAAFPDARTRS